MEFGVLVKIELNLLVYNQHVEYCIHVHVWM